MWHFVRTVGHWFDRLNRQEWLALLLVVMVVGFMCMRGYGSRSNY